MEDNFDHGIGRLADVLSERMAEQARTNPQVTLGTMAANANLEVDGLDSLIPKDMYMRASGLNGLTTGDRVAVAFIGDKPLILCKVKENG